MGRRAGRERGHEGDGGEEGGKHGDLGRRSVGRKERRARGGQGGWWEERGRRGRLFSGGGSRPDVCRRRASQRWCVRYLINRQSAGAALPSVLRLPFAPMTASQHGPSPWLPRRLFCDSLDSITQLPSALACTHGLTAARSPSASDHTTRRTSSSPPGVFIRAGPAAAHMRTSRQTADCDKLLNCLPGR